MKVEEYSLGKISVYRLHRGYWRVYKSVSLYDYKL